MMKPLGIAIMMSAAGAMAAPAAQLRVIPEPAVVELADGRISLSGAAIESDDPFVGAYARDVLGATSQPDGPRVRLSLVEQGSSGGNEAYELNVTEAGVEIRSANAAGLFYGLQTLRQMMDSKESVPLGRILDRPRFPYRGLMLDSGRHIQSVEYVKSLIDRMAELKMNRFHWHLTEDQGWRIEIEKYPELTKTGAHRTRGAQRYGGFYTKQQIQEVVAHAKSRFVTIVPEIDMPGHMQAAVASYPLLGCTGEKLPVRWEWGISQEVLCAGREETYTFCENVLSEVLVLFPDSPVIHIGGDECPKDRWKACPKCQAKIKELGLKDEHALQGHFTARMAKFLESKGRRLQGWNEIMQGTDLPKGVIVQQWDNPAAATLAAKSGLEVVVSPTSHAYFDYRYADIWTQKVYEFEPVPKDLPTEFHHQILGPQANLWTEHLETSVDVDYMAWPRAVAMAEVGWSMPERRSWESFRVRIEGWIARQPEGERAGLRERVDLYAEVSMPGSK